MYQTCNQDMRFFSWLFTKTEELLTLAWTNLTCKGLVWDYFKLGWRGWGGTRKRYALVDSWDQGPNKFSWFSFLDRDTIFRQVVGTEFARYHFLLPFSSFGSEIWPKGCSFESPNNGQNPVFKQVDTFPCPITNGDRTLYELTLVRICWK